MSLRLPSVVLAIAVLCGLALLLHSRQALPPLVASHFDAAGAANGFMPRAVYLGFTAVLQVGVPLLLAVLPRRAMGADGARLNLPNKAYWLAPERRAETIASLTGQGAWLAAFCAVFFCYVQWLVIEANRRQPPQMAMAEATAGLLVFVAATLLLVLRMIARFRRTA